MIYTVTKTLLLINANSKFGFDFLLSVYIYNMIASFKKYLKPKATNTPLVITKVRNGKRYDNVDFLSTDFSGKSLNSLTFNFCSFNDVDFTDVDITNTRFLDSTFNNECNFIDSKFRGAHFERVKFHSCDLLDVDFEDAVFIDCRFESVNLKYANLIGSKWTDVLSTNADFEGANLTRAKMTKVNLEGADLTDATLVGADFRNAKLAGTDLTGADLTGANFVGADTTGADFTDADITGADFGDAGPPLGNGRVQPPQSLLPPLVFSPSYKIIDKFKLASDAIEGDVKMIEYLTSEEGIDSLAFLYNNVYYLIDKERLTNMIKSETRDEKINNSIVYECKNAGTMSPENIVDNMPFMKIASIGIPVNYAYIPIQYIQDVLGILERSPKNTRIEDRIYEFVKTPKQLVSVVSYQLLYGITGAVGASHCQEGQNGDTYKLKKVKNAGKIVSNAIKRVATAKKSIRGGRKTIKNAIKVSSKKVC